MFPQYAERNIGGEIAIWLLITVGALLVPIIVIAICCIRRHCWQMIPPPRRRPPSSLAMMTNREDLLTDSTSWSNHTWHFLTTKPNVRLIERPCQPTMTNTKQAEVLRSYNGPYLGSVHDGMAVSIDTDMTPPTFSRTNSLKKSHVHWPKEQALSHVIQTAIMPAGSTVDSVGANEFTIPCKSSTSISAGYNSIV